MIIKGEASTRGSIIDTMVDQMVVTLTTVTMIHVGHASAWPAGLYIFFYLVVVVFAMVRHLLAAPYSWLFRPRFLVFGWFIVEVYWWQGSLDWVLWLASALLALKALTGFITIRKRI